MKPSWPSALFAVLIPLATVLSRAQSIIINEIFNSSSSDEWVELLVVDDSLDLRTWDLRDFSSGGTPQDPLNFSSAGLWSALRAGTVVVVAKPTSPLTEDDNPADFVLIIKTDNSLYFNGNDFVFAGSSDALQIRASTDVHVFGVSWGSNNERSLPEPRVYFDETSESNTSISFGEDSPSELTDPENWTMDDTASTPGHGNSVANSDWIEELRSPANGSGSAIVQPDTMEGGETADLQVTYYPDPDYLITDLRIILPSSFSWSHTSMDITYSGFSATMSLIGDTISFNGITFTADSGQIAVDDIAAPDSSALYPVRVQTRVTAYADVAPIPLVVVFGPPTSIALVTTNDSSGIPTRLGELVTVQGTITVANQFGEPSFLQDNSGGIAVLGTAEMVNVGDEVSLSGIVSHSNGLTELTDPFLHAVLSTGKQVIALTTSCSAIFADGGQGSEQYEGRLVRINVVTVGDTQGNPISTWAVSGSGTNYRLFDSTGYLDVRVDADVDFANTPAPQGPFDILGVVGQYRSMPPYIGGYQLLPRWAADILADGPVIASEPVETEIQQTALTINWTTIHPGTSRLRFGRTLQYDLGVVAPDDILRISHAVVLSTLEPATVYNVQAFSVAEKDTSYASNLIVSTASPDGTTGEVHVYFNRSVYTGVSTGEQALGNEDLVARLLTRIENAHRSIDAALYSLSGAPGDIIASSLVIAKQRGISVRVICESDNRETNAFNELQANGVPLIDDRLDPANDGAGLMHNKFLVFDYRGGPPESVWVWTGSWNLTEQQTTTDHQNSIEIQDVALAGAYTLEFNEMWGSETEIPDSSHARFGARKRDNTPHRFNVNGLPLCSYFSPGDRTTTQIKNTLALGERDIAFALFAFTLADVADVLLERRSAGMHVRGVMESSVAPEQFVYLSANGIDVHLEPTGNLLHHKYGIVDASKGINGPQWVITGSQNWSFNGENRNNENTLIIESPRVANLYLQEFAARYYEAGGEDSIFADVRHTDIGVPLAYSLEQNYPNPFNSSTIIDYRLPIDNYVTLKVYDLLGREVATIVSEQLRPGTYTREWDASMQASGVYFYRLRTGPVVLSRKMVLLK